MTYTVFTAALELSKLLNDTQEGTATGGSTTTLLDTSRTEPDDHFNGGTIWFISGNNANKSAVITDWAIGTGTFTFATQTGACAASNLYACASKDYPRWLLYQSINKALQSIGDILDRDTSLVTVEDQSDYTLPSGVYNVKRVEIALDSDAPYRWQIQRNWREIEGKIVFDPGHEPLADDYTIRLTYMAPHSAIDDDTDTISDYIHKELLVWAAALHAYEWRMGRVERDEPWVKDARDRAQVMTEQMKMKHPILRLERDPRVGNFP